MDVMNAADEKVNHWVRSEGFNVRLKSWADEFCFEADEDVEVLGILFL